MHPSGLKELISLKQGSDELKHPNLPRYARVKPKYSDKDANGLTKCIVDYIDLRGGWATRISTEGRYIESLGYRIPSSVKLGTADIHACWKGLHLSIEVKIGSDRQSKEQKEIETDILRAGGQYFIARNFQDFYQWIHTL